MENILKQFFEFEKIESCQPFGNGHINDTHKVELLINSVSQSFLLQRFNHQVFKKPHLVMENIGMVADHLSKKNYPYKILKPYKSKSDSWLYKDGVGNFWRVFNFIKNTRSFEKIETEEQAYLGAKAFGIFLKAFDGFEVNKLNITIPDFHNGEKRLNDFKDAVKNAWPERKKTAERYIDEIIENENIFRKINNSNLPQRVIHHDTKINNILFKKNNNKAAAIIDLDTVMPGIVLSDFGDMVRTFTSPVDEDEKDISKIEIRSGIYQALNEGFLSEMETILTQAEKDNLKLAGPWITLMQAIRFLGDYLIGDVYYKTKHPDHNLIRAKNQLALFRSMQKVLE